MPTVFRALLMKRCATIGVAMRTRRFFLVYELSLVMNFSMGIGLLASRMDTLFMPAPKKDQSFYLSIYLNFSLDLDYF